MGCESHSKCNIPADALVLGILGGGMAGYMLVQAARAIGVKTAVLDPSPDAPALRICDHSFVGALDDEQAIRSFIAVSTQLTYVSNTCDVGILRKYAAVIPVHPNPETFSITQDAFFLKQFLTSLQIPVAPGAAKRKSSARGRIYTLPLGRARDDRLFFFPAISAPAKLSASVAKKIKSIAQRIGQSLDYVGVISIEFVLTEKDGVFVRGITPYVNASVSHSNTTYTISPFEEHVRLVCSLTPKQPRLKRSFAHSRRISNNISV